MTIRKPIEINPTMKVDGSGENAMPFKEMKAVILEVTDLETKYGSSIKAVVENAEEDMKFSVFLNNFSIERLCEAYGEDDTVWIGKVVEIKKEIDPIYKAEMIVLCPVVEESEEDEE